MFSKQINSESSVNGNEIKTIYTVEKWRLIINQTGQCYQLSLIDKWDIEQPIHQLMIYQRPEERKNTSIADLFKQMFENKSNNKPQLLKHEGSFIVIYAPYGLLGGGKTERWIAGTTSIIGMIGGTVIVFKGNFLGKILIDTSAGLLFHACLDEEVTTDSCLGTVAKSAVTSVLTNSLFTLANFTLIKVGNWLPIVLVGANKTQVLVNSAEKIEKINQPLSKSYLKMWDFLKKNIYFTSSSVGQKFFTQYFNKVVLKDENIPKENFTLKNLSFDIFIAAAACGTSLGIKEFLQNSQGILDLRTKNLFLSWDINRNWARVLGKSIDNGIQSSAQTFIEEYFSSKLKVNHKFDHVSKLKIGISGISAAVYSGIGKAKKIQIENIFKKYEQNHNNLLNEKNIIVNEYGIFVQIYRKIINRLSFEPEKFNIKDLETHMKIHFQLANEALIQREMDGIQKQDENRPPPHHVTYYNTLEETRFLSEVLKTSRDNKEILERVKQRSQLILNRFGLDQVEIGNKLNLLDVQIKDNLLMFVHACDEFQKNNYSLEKLSERHYNTYVNANRLAFETSRIFHINPHRSVGAQAKLAEELMRLKKRVEDYQNKQLDKKIKNLEKNLQRCVENQNEDMRRLLVELENVINCMMSIVIIELELNSLLNHTESLLNTHHMVEQKTLNKEDIKQKIINISNQVLIDVNQGYKIFKCYIDKNYLDIHSVSDSLIKLENLFKKYGNIELNKIEMKKSIMKRSIKYNASVIIQGVESFIQGMYDNRLEKLLESGGLSTIGYVAHHVLQTVLYLNESNIKNNQYINYYALSILEYVVNNDQQTKLMVTSISEEYKVITLTINENIAKNLKKAQYLMTATDIWENPNISNEKKQELYLNYVQQVKIVLDEILSAYSQLANRVIDILGTDVTSRNKQFIEDYIQSSQDVMQVMIDSTKKIIETPTFNLFNEVYNLGSKIKDTLKNKEKNANIEENIQSLENNILFFVENLLQEDEFNRQDLIQQKENQNKTTSINFEINALGDGNCAYKGCLNKLASPSELSETKQPVNNTDHFVISQKFKSKIENRRNFFINSFSQSNPVEVISSFYNQNHIEKTFHDKQEKNQTNQQTKKNQIPKEILNSKHGDKIESLESKKSTLQDKKSDSFSNFGIPEIDEKIFTFSKSNFIYAECIEYCLKHDIAEKFKLSGKLNDSFLGTDEIKNWVKVWQSSNVENRQQQDSDLKLNKFFEKLKELENQQTLVCIVVFKNQYSPKGWHFTLLSFRKVDEKIKLLYVDTFGNTENFDTFIQKEFYPCYNKVAEFIGWPKLEEPMIYCENYQEQNECGIHVWRNALLTCGLSNENFNVERLKEKIIEEKLNLKGTTTNYRYEMAIRLQNDENFPLETGVERIKIKSNLTNTCDKKDDVKEINQSSNQNEDKENYENSVKFVQGNTNLQKKERTQFNKSSQNNVINEEETRENFSQPLNLHVGQSTSNSKKIDRNSNFRNNRKSQKHNDHEISASEIKDIFISCPKEIVENFAVLELDKKNNEKIRKVFTYFNNKLKIFADHYYCYKIKLTAEEYNNIMGKNAFQFWQTELNFDEEESSSSHDI